MIQLQATMYLRNDAMIQWRECRGMTQREAAEHCGVPFGLWIELEKLEYPPRYPERHILAIAMALAVPPDQIMPEDLKGVSIGRKVSKTIEVATEQVLALEQCQKAYAERCMLPPADADLLQSETVELVNRALETLSHREREILRLRFGLGKDGFRYTLDATARIFKVSRGMVRHIEVRALRKLQHPARRLQELVEPLR